MRAFYARFDLALSRSSLIEEIGTDIFALRSTIGLVSDLQKHGDYGVTDGDHYAAAPDDMAVVHALVYFPIFLRRISRQTIASPSSAMGRQSPALSRTPFSNRSGRALFEPSYSHTRTYSAASLLLRIHHRLRGPAI